MVYFNLISGFASIASLALSIFALKAVYNVKVEIGLTSKAHNRIEQKAEGSNIRQAGGDLHG